MTGQNYIDVINEIFNHPSFYNGLTIKENNGTVRFLANKFDLSRLNIITILKQMLADEQLEPCGYYGFDMTYKAIKENQAIQPDVTRQIGKPERAERWSK